MNHWDHRFLALADLVSTWSKDPSTQVGAVVVDGKNRVVSLGFNGFPRGVNDAPVGREAKLLRTVHAEVNAIAFARRDVEGCTLYVTHPPCAGCAAQIIQHGLARVVFPKASRSFISRWGMETLAALDMLDHVGIEIEVLQ